MYGVVMENTIKTLLSRGESQRGIARQLGISRKVVRRIHRQIKNGLPSPSYQRGKKLDPHKEQIKSWLEQGLSITLIHGKLADKYSLKVGYATVRRFVADLRGEEVFVPIHREPGEEGQVDFGYMGRFNLADGKSVKVWVFCMVLAHSRYAYYEVVTDQSVLTFINCHIHAFEFFGGIPNWISLDNLKAGVIQPDFYEPLLQEQYSEFLQHYSSVGKPCKVRHPHHKGKVESGVKYVKNNFLKALEHQDYGRLQKDLTDWTINRCNQRVHGTTRKIPVQVFAQIEQAKLLQLPAQRYEVWQWEHRKVSRLGHICFQSSYYSVPYTLAGKTLRIKTNGSIVKVFDGHTEVALHEQSKEKGTYVTRTEHLVPYKQARAPAYYREKLSQIGLAAVALFDAILLEQKSHWKEKAQGIVSLKRHYEPDLINAACQRALDYGVYNYKTVRNICRLGLVEQSKDTALPNSMGGFNHDLALYDQL